MNGFSNEMEKYAYSDYAKCANSEPRRATLSDKELMEWQKERIAHLERKLEAKINPIERKLAANCWTTPKLFKEHIEVMDKTEALRVLNEPVDHFESESNIIPAYLREGK